MNTACLKCKGTGKIKVYDMNLNTYDNNRGFWETCDRGNIDFGIMELDQTKGESRFAEKSNKEIAEIMDIPLKEVHAGRSRFGWTIAKVEAELKKQKSPNAAIKAEIERLRKVIEEAYQTIKDCDKKMLALEKKLFGENLVRIARGK